MAIRKVDGKQVLTVRIDDGDKAVLDALAKFEHLNLSNVTRRAIHHYAKALGVTPEAYQTDPYR